MPATGRRARSPRFRRRTTTSAILDGMNDDLLHGLDLPVSPYSPDANGEYVGLFATSPVAGGKRLQACALFFDDGQTVLIGYRPRPEYFPFEGKRVAIRGHMRNPALENPEVQAVLGWHLEVASIRLADGEVPYDPSPTTLPRPPRVTRRADLATVRCPYVRLSGILTAVERTRARRAHLTLRLEDGEVIASDTPVRSHMLDALEAGLPGDLCLDATVTVFARTSINGAPSGLGLDDGKSTGPRTKSRTSRTA